MLTLVDISNQLGLQPDYLQELSTIASSLYTTFDRLKKSGGVRSISAPKDKLKRVQRLILDGLLATEQLPPYLHGCVKGRSIVTNAEGHIAKPLVLNIDLINFYGAIRYERVVSIFQDTFGCDSNAAEVLTHICVYGNSLPQGAPTSPTLANIAALSLDRELIEICEQNVKHYGYHYSRYVDDITISGGVELAPLLQEFFKAVEKNGFRANTKKLKIARPSERQKVTGIVVNKKLSVPKKLIRKVRQELYYCEKYGIDSHCERKEIAPEKFLMRIRGLIGYIRMTGSELANDFEVRLFKVRQRSTVVAPDDEEQMLKLLSGFIAHEQTITFVYDLQNHHVAPTEILMDDDGFKILRGFQISPKQGWETFLVSKITSIAIQS